MLKHLVWHNREQIKAVEKVWNTGELELRGGAEMIDLLLFVFLVLYSRYMSKHQLFYLGAWEMENCKWFTL